METWLVSTGDKYEVFQPIFAGLPLPPAGKYLILKFQQFMH